MLKLTPDSIQSHTVENDLFKTYPKSTIQDTTENLIHDIVFLINQAYG